MKLHLRAYEAVREIKRTGKIKISIKGLTTPLACTIENRKTCHIKFTKGVCCINHSKEHHTQYCLEEIENLPPEIKKFVDSEGNVAFDENGHCKLIPICSKDYTHKPLLCSIAPLGFNKNGRLILQRMAWLRPCPLYKQGDPIYISMKDCLIQVLGQENYSIIVQMIKEGVEEN